ncbi:MAG: FemAB family PEP-CTERM system-associated protein [Phycisphaerae bacterium]|nr:FemAB family PEP-CTERM system-associated protein [Planctomycetia bacterium]MCK6465749.1 FemAB family PEP-CTERM system-associated protein [Phycisphaerae bacterium]MCL4719083.1 FemAB family PEP-CTERM system-associated protein [Phycisphaerae bacterium]NUQ08962.1 FemAB family PEP-CTERM system-associated protein [Phycisphaerae bacterium]
MSVQLLDYANDVTTSGSPVSAAERIRTGGGTARATEPPLVIRESSSVESQRWDAFVQSHPQGTIFHTQAFRQAVASTFPHRARYLTAERGGRIVGVLPMFDVRTGWAGRRLVSVPYGVGGGALAEDEPTANALADAAVALAAELCCAVIDLRGGASRLRGFERVDGYLGFRRELPANPSDIATWIPRKARAEVRHARERHGVTIDEGDEHLNLAWRLYSENMRRLASLNYPRRFFAALLEATRDQHRITLARRRGVPVAALVSFTHRDAVMPYFFGATREARSCGAAHLLYAELAEWATERGLRTFDFGRSRAGNTGSADFKRFFGFEATVLPYQRWTAPSMNVADPSPASPKVRFARRFWPRLPLCVTRPLGAWLSRWVTG